MKEYGEKLFVALALIEWGIVEDLYQALQKCNRVFLIGNGGSAANAMHIANDWSMVGLKASALVDPAIITRIGNDKGYANIFSWQLWPEMQMEKDLLVALSGSGNSENIVNGLIAWHSGYDMTSCAIVGYDGGRAKALASMAIHTPVNDMQISEDIQLIVGHAITQRFMQK